MPPTPQTAIRRVRRAWRHGIVMAAVATIAGSVTVATPLDASSAADRFGLVPVESNRAVDTRIAVGGGMLRAGEVRFFPLPDVPAEAIAVVANVTATDSAAGGYLLVDDCSTTSTASVLNLVPGRAVPNQVVVGLAADGRRGVCARASTSTHVIVDLFGVVVPDGAMFRPSSRRLHDSRLDGGIDGVLRVDLGPTVSAFADRGVVAWTGTVTATDVTRPGYVAAWPCARPAPTISQLNLTPGVTSANQVTVEVPVADPTLCLRRVGTGELVVDSTGVWTSSSARGATLRPTSPPRRIFDSRLGAPMARSEVRRVHAAADAVLMVNVTATRSAAGGYVAVFECDAGDRGTSTLNLSPGVDVAASTTVSAASGGVCLTTSARTDLIVDLFAVQEPTGRMPISDAGVPIGGELVRPGIDEPVLGPVISPCEVAPLDEVNAVRAELGRAAFVSDARTTDFACWWATQMAETATMSHSTPQQRSVVDACGIVAENVGRSPGERSLIMQAWLNSEPHRGNMIHPTLSRATVAYVSRTEGSTVTWYGVIAFGGQC